MDIKWLTFAAAACIGAGAQGETLKYSFNDFEAGPISGQHEWNTYDKVPDTSALSIMDQVGTSEADGDKALVIKASKTPIRCVTGEPVRWLPGYTLEAEFDFKIAADPRELIIPKPVMSVMVGNALLSPKARWEVKLEASPSGDWVLTGAMPDESSKRIYGENFLIRENNAVSISQWYKMRLVSKKLTEPDSFETRVEILGAESGELIAEIEFSDNKKDKVAKEMWNTSRAHIGFFAPDTQLGLVCIDNLTITSSK
ncbi:hypothetical protein [Pontiella agarivorans]|uniref:Uncharacterized protein n=1 Tax=Pontiella agarivorans TaxID=3038953 RepID=A0ABU5N1L4_9BACT|nr:hypothetical protein [Pontiella agarivorans]MDZ8120330.1 hypothetical protein [Pontiella agarivorans]